MRGCLNARNNQQQERRFKMAQHTPTTKELMKAYQEYRWQQDRMTWGGWVEGRRTKRYTAEFNRWLKQQQSNKD